jgi:hypothetical protein
MTIHDDSPAALARAMFARLGDLGVDGPTTALAELAAPLHEFRIGLAAEPHAPLLVGPALIPYLEHLSAAVLHTLTRDDVRQGIAAGRSLAVAARLVAHRLPQVPASSVPELVVEDDVSVAYLQCAWELRGTAERLAVRMTATRLGDWEDPRHVAGDVADIHDLALVWSAVLRAWPRPASASAGPA